MICLYVQVKSDMRLAPNTRNSLTSKLKFWLEGALETQSEGKLYLEELRLKEITPRCATSTWALTDFKDDVVILGWYTCLPFIIFTCLVKEIYEITQKWPDSCLQGMEMLENWSLQPHVAFISCSVQCCQFSSLWQSGGCCPYSATCSCYQLQCSVLPVFKSLAVKSGHFLVMCKSYQLPVSKAIIPRAETENSSSWSGENPMKR